MATPSYTLVIGTKMYSSWSLRPWLAMRHAGIRFTEERVKLRQDDTRAQILQHSPSGKVPVLKVDSGPHAGLLVWDSLSICEYLAETHRDAKLWPGSAEARALARSAAAEMHSGFQALREHCPMDFLAKVAAHPLPAKAREDVRRIVALWGECRSKHGAEGPFLFGTFTIADAMFAPVVSRFNTYVPNLALHGDDGTAAAYVAEMMALPEMQLWGEDARREAEEGGFQSQGGT